MSCQRTGLASCCTSSGRSSRTSGVLLAIHRADVANASAPGTPRTRAAWPSRSAAGFMRLLWDGTLTASGIARFAPFALAISIARWTAAVSPAMTTCPAELKLTASTTPPLRSRFSAGRLDVGIGQAEDHRHQPRARRHRFLHHLTAELHDVDGSREVQRAGRDQRGVFTEAVTRNGGGFATTELAPQTRAWRCRQRGARVA